MIKNKIKTRKVEEINKKKATTSKEIIKLFKTLLFLYGLHFMLFVAPKYDEFMFFSEFIIAALFLGTLLSAILNLLFNYMHEKKIKKLKSEIATDEKNT